MKVEDYAKELMDAGGITDAEQRKAFESFFGSEKVRTRLSNTLSDIEAEKGRAAAEKKRAEDMYQNQLKSDAENKRIFESNQKIVTDAQATVAAYEKEYGPLTGAERRQAVQDVIDKKTFEEANRKRDNDVVALMSASF